ncbi:DapH/DapD/GlmU-related protein [Novosphingobium sp. MMS21-SN21R]|uniref:acyltransferase n=1 Tax=Novosphingobium sp. MMS21-SN21R TaxID=2969298 RepID=UPI002884AB5C|nr:DapH/DapD/GlmU-related protein [Novosphingobium sp. MMS21-SN21R]MDT0509455.1 DapH/DapD/GlmU-related protein [Novosphingobium sp. MMS21-SN21R]
MTSAPALPSRSTTLQQKWQRLIQTRLWQMDIHRSAWIAPTALIDRTWPKGIHIAAGCVIDHQAVVLTHDMTRGVYLDTRIGEGTRIGARTIIMPGVTIGANCIIEPGSVVNRDVPDGSHMMGNPAKPVAA